MAKLFCTKSFLFPSLQRPLSLSLSQQIIISRFSNSNSNSYSYSPSELRKVTEWVQKFQIQDIPVDSFQISFARSRGPGGQNVNKGTRLFSLFCIFFLLLLSQSFFFFVVNTKVDFRLAFFLSLFFKEGGDLK